MSRFGPETHDFGHAMIAPVDQRLAGDTLNRSSGAWSLRFAPRRLAQQRLKNGARHACFLRADRSQAWRAKPFWANGLGQLWGEKLGSGAVRRRVSLHKARVNFL